MCVAVEEICLDEVDNDCDGKIDEGCGNACWVECETPPPRACLDDSTLQYFLIPGQCTATGGCWYDAVEHTCAQGCLEGACKEDACIGLVCPDDGKQCTDDSCDPSSGCVYANRIGPCDDGDHCTEGDTCEDGRCAYGDPVDCVDDWACTDDICDPRTGCVHQAFNERCDDGDPCTTDVCDESMGCTHPYNADPCDDWNACTMNDACAGGVCTGGLPADMDGDGFVDVECGGDDCEDDNPDSHPGGVEVCDGSDNDCDGFTDVLGVDQTDPCRYDSICQGGVPVACSAAAGPTIAPDIVDIDTLWCANGSPYLMERSLVVLEGSTLTVGPCTEVRVVDGAGVYVNGALDVQASHDYPSMFTSGSAAPWRGSWAGIELRDTPGARITLNGAIVEYAFKGLLIHCCDTGGPIKIEGSIFQHNETSFEGWVSFQPEVHHTELLDNMYGGFIGGWKLHDCTFSGNYKGLGASESVDLDGCSFVDNVIGMENAQASVRNCLIARNSETGIQPSTDVYGLGMPYEIMNCTIIDNGIGVLVDHQYVTHLPEIHQTTLCGNYEYNIKMATWLELNATNNWWCTTGPEEISSRIYDVYDDVSLGEVIFSPFLDHAP